jgi:hypothetical protein
MYTADANNLLLHVSTLHGCHHQRVFLLNTEYTHSTTRTVPYLVFEVAIATIADHLVKTAVPAFTAYMQLEEISWLSLNTVAFCG